MGTSAKTRQFNYVTMNECHIATVRSYTSKSIASIIDSFNNLITVKINNQPVGRKNKKQKAKIPDSKILPNLKGTRAEKVAETSILHISSRIPNNKS